MDITFVCRGFESIGIEYLSAVLKKSGHIVDLIFDPALFDTMFIVQKKMREVLSFYPLIKKRLKNKTSGIFAFSVSSEDYDWACETAKFIKEIHPESKIIFGGIHPSAVPEEVIKNPHIDFICIGEGEYPLLDLADALEHKTDITKIPNIWTKIDRKIFRNDLRPLLQNLNALPFPDKELFHAEYNGFSTHYYNIVTSRGCPCECSFCYPSFYKKLYLDKGKFLRKRSVKNVIEELVLAKKRYNLKMVNFLDDVFIFDKKWFLEFALEYRKKINVPNFCFIHPLFIDNDIVRHLEIMNTRAVNMGIQVISEEVRKKVLNRYETNHQIEQAIKQVRATKIFLYVDILLGVPGQNSNELIDTARFLNANKPDAVTVCWLKFYPGTNIKQIGELIDNNGISELNKKEMGKLGFLIIISNLLPQALMSFIIKRKWFKIFPALSSEDKKTYTLNFILACIISFFKEIFRTRRTTALYAFRKVFKYYLFFTRKLIKKKLIIR